MNNMVMMFRHQLKKRIETLNIEMEEELFSSNLKDYSFIQKSKNKDNFLTISFLDVKNEKELELIVKVIE